MTTEKNLEAKLLAEASTEGLEKELRSRVDLPLNIPTTMAEVKEARKTLARMVLPWEKENSPPNWVRKDGNGNVVARVDRRLHDYQNSFDPSAIGWMVHMHMTRPGSNNGAFFSRKGLVAVRPASECQSSGSFIPAERVIDVDGAIAMLRDQCDEHLRKFVAGGGWAILVDE